MDESSETVELRNTVQPHDGTPPITQKEPEEMRGRWLEALDLVDASFRHDTAAGRAILQATDDPRELAGCAADVASLVLLNLPNGAGAAMLAEMRDATPPFGW